MYIELFILDNLLMNLLILRLGAALLSVRPPLYRQITIALTGALYAALAASLLPALGSIFMRPLILALMAHSIPARTLKGFGIANLATLGATLVVGGLVTALALLLGGSTDGLSIRAGIPLRVALLGAALASLTPKAVRRLLSRRLTGRAMATLEVEHHGISRSFTALIDTGNRMREPLSGLPVALVYCPAFRKSANIPIPAATANGKLMLYGFLPEHVLVDGVPTMVIIAVSDKRLDVDAILPPEAGVRVDNIAA